MKNTNVSPSRRRFLKGLAAAGVAMPAMNLLSNVAFAASGQANHTIINVYLRGAMDSLSALIPYNEAVYFDTCLLYTSPSPRDGLLSRMPSSA